MKSGIAAPPPFNKTNAKRADGRSPTKPHEKCEINLSISKEQGRILESYMRSYDNLEESQDYLMNALDLMSKRDQLRYGELSI